MLRALRALPADGFVVALLAVVALAAVLPATGAFGDALSVATKVVIALLFALYGARLVPRARRGTACATGGCTCWCWPPRSSPSRCSGLAAKALVPGVLTPDLYTGVLFLCLVPSTVQSSIAFTSIAHGNVPAAIVSASLSNILGVVLTPLLVVLLLQTAGGVRVDGSAVLDIVVQLLLPFVDRPVCCGRWVAGWLGPPPGGHQDLRPRFDPAGGLHGLLAQHDRAHLEHGQRAAARSRWPRCARLLLAIMLARHRRDRPAGPAEPGGHDRCCCSAAPRRAWRRGCRWRWCSSEPGAVGLIMLPLMIFHQIQLLACAAIASRMSRADEVGELSSG